jgi:hypothetical protein
MIIDKTLKLFALALMLLIGVGGVYVARGLYADGSFWLFEMLSRGGFYIFDPHRAYAQILMQMPVIVSLELGVQDLNFLIRAHSIGFVFVPLIFWIAALALQINNRLFWLFLMAFTVTYLRSNFFAVGEFNITYGMAAFCASILLRQNIPLGLSALLMFASLVLIRSYEMILFLGPLLAGLASWRLLKEKHDLALTRVCIIVSLSFFLISSYIGLQSVFFQRPYDARSTANLGALTEIHLLYLVTIPLMASVLATASGKICKCITFFLAGILVILYVIYTLRWDKSHISFEYLSYAYRALCGLLLGQLLVCAAYIHYTRCSLNRKNSLFWDTCLGIIATAFFISLSLPMLSSTNKFHIWLKRFEATALEITTNTPINLTDINMNHGLNQGPNWMWGNVYTSILLRGDATAVILNNTQCECLDAPDKLLIERLQGGGTSNDDSHFKDRPLNGLKRTSKLLN